MAQRLDEQRRTGEGERRAPSGARPGGWGPGRAGSGDLITRLEHLEALVTAIAEHLGVRPGRMPPRRGISRREGSAEPRAAPPESTHAVVRIVAGGLSGRVKMYNVSRGYGFVVSPDAPGDVFFHRSDCRADPSMLQPGSEVTFDLVAMANGQLKAVRLEPVPRERRQDRPALPAGASTA